MLATESIASNTGIGLAPEVLERLFEAFFSTKDEGMGIGLNLCRSIVESHRGRMHAENIYNGPDVVGCRFSFWIPVSGAIDAQENAGPPQVFLSPSGGSRTPSGSGGILTSD